MKHKLAIICFTVLIFSFNTAAISYSQNHTLNQDIDLFKFSESGELAVIAGNNFKIFKNETMQFQDSGNFAPDIDLIETENGPRWMAGTRYYDTRFIVVENGQKIEEYTKIGIGHDRGAFLTKNLVLTSNSYNPKLVNISSGNSQSIANDYGFTVPLDRKDIDSDNVIDLFAKPAGNQQISRIGETGYIWKTDFDNSRRGVLLDTDKFLAASLEEIFLINSSNGNLIWKTSSHNFQNTVTAGSNGYAVTNDSILEVDTEERKLEIVRKFDFEIDNVEGLNSGALLASSNDRLFKIDSKGAILTEKYFPEEISQIQSLDNNAAVSYGNKISRITLENQKTPKIQNIENKTIYGDTNSVLKAVAHGKTAFISDNKDKINSTTDKPITKAEDVEWPAFNYKEKYYAENRVKKILLTVLASNRNATVVFNEDAATKDFSNIPIEKIRSELIKESKTNHVVASDTNGKPGLLAAVIASELNATVVKTDNTTNTRENIISSFDRIGENSETLFNGKYVSLIDAPSKSFDDPVPSFNNPQIETDLLYGNLDGDNELEASVGRYPDNIEKASLMFQRSKERKRGGKAVVASEYLHSNWPVVLSTLGGGVKTGTAAEEIMEDQNYQVTHLIEHRAKPLQLLTSITGIPGLLDSTAKLEYGLAMVISKGTAAAVKNSILIVKGLEYTEQGLKVYYEYDWENYEKDFEIDFPDNPSISEVEEFADGVLPDRHKKLNQSNLAKEVKDAKLVYYSGRGDQSWVMPDDKDKTAIKNFYSGDNKIEAEELALRTNAIVFDSSNNGGSADNPMKDRALENASSLIGFTDTSYHSYASIIGTEFLKHGKTSGNGFRRGINKLRSSFIVYSPQSSYLPGVRRKMSKTARLYGNPETPKDPVPVKERKITKNCDEEVCEVTVKLKSDYDIEEVGEKKQVVFNSSNHLIRPLKPITPIKIFDYKLPENSELVDYSIEENFSSYEYISNPVYRPLTHGGNTLNQTYDNETFPEKTFRFNSSDEIEYVQALQQVEENRTRVLEESAIRFSYRSDLNLDTKLNDKALVADIYSGSRRNCSLEYRINGNIYSKQVSLEDSETIDLETLDEGVHNFESALLCENQTAFDTRTFRISEPVEIHLFSPEIAEGEVRKVKAVIDNPNSFAVNKEVELETNSGVILDLLENRERKTEIRAKDSEIVSWNVLGIEKGNHRVSVGTEGETVEVIGSRNSLSKVTPKEILRKVKGVRSEFSYSTTSSSSKLKVKSNGVKLLITQESDLRSETLKTPSYKLHRKFGPEQTVTILESPNGFYKSKTVSGNSITESNGLKEKEFSEKTELLDKEVEKFSKVLNANSSR